MQNPYEIAERVGPDGVLTLSHLPFPIGQEVNVCIGSTPDAPTALAPFAFGLHTGLITVCEDFDAPLPDPFWLGEDETPS